MCTKEGATQQTKNLRGFAEDNEEDEEEGALFVQLPGLLQHWRETADVNSLEQFQEASCWNRNLIVPKQFLLCIKNTTIPLAKAIKQTEEGKTSKVREAETRKSRKAQTSLYRAREVKARWPGAVL